MQNPKLEIIAQKVLDKVKPTDAEKFGAIITILMIISIILTTIRVIQECHKNKLRSFHGKNKYEYFGQQIKQTAIKRTWFTKIMLKKTIRKELSREAYKQYGVILMNAILDTGEQLKDDELITLAEAANV